jgi:hypothetical protein
MDERTTSRKIVHIDMDAFYASVEQRDDPDLRGKPVIVAWKGNRSVVCAASYEARKFGVRSTMPAITSERLCPEAIFIPPDFARYTEASRGAREIFQRHTDLINGCRSMKSTWTLPRTNWSAHGDSRCEDDSSANPRGTKSDSFGRRRSKQIPR